ncbi:hypothetical protein ACJZ2D_002210 [Fusarium nematophilum]
MENNEGLGSIVWIGTVHIALPGSHPILILSSYPENRGLKSPTKSLEAPTSTCEAQGRVLLRSPDSNDTTFSISSEKALPARAFRGVETGAMDRDRGRRTIEDRYTRLGILVGTETNWLDTFCDRSGEMSPLESSGQSCDYRDLELANTLDEHTRTGPSHNASGANQESNVPAPEPPERQRLHDTSSSRLQLVRCGPGPRWYFIGMTTGKSLGMALENRGGPLLGTDHLGGPEAQSGKGRGAQDHEAHVPEVRFSQDPIATSLEGIHHVVGREVEVIDIDESDRETERARAGESAADRR